MVDGTNPLLDEDDEDSSGVVNLLMDESDDDDFDELPDLDVDVLSAGEFKAPPMVEGTDPDSVFPVNYDDYARMDQFRDNYSADADEKDSGSIDESGDFEAGSGALTGDSFEDYLEEYESDDFSSGGEDSDDFEGSEKGVSVPVVGDSLESLIGFSDGDDVFLDVDDDEDDETAYYTLKLDEIITRAIDSGASDIDLHPNDEVSFAILGDMKRIPEFGILNERQLSNAYEDITTHVAQDFFIQQLELDTSYQVRSGKYAGRRLRLNVARTFDGVALTFRVISDKIPSPADLGIDERLLKWIDMPNGLVLINGSTGQGKALGHDTAIPTPTGWTTMGELKVGDRVYDSKMNSCNVEWVSEVNESPELYRIRFSDGQKIIADINHQWIVSSAISRKNQVENFDSSLSTMSTRDLLNAGVVLDDGSLNFAVPLVREESEDKGYSRDYEFKSNGLSLTTVVDSVGFSLSLVDSWLSDSSVRDRVLFDSFFVRLSLVNSLLDSYGCFDEGVNKVLLSESLMGDMLSLVRSLGVVASLVGDEIWFSSLNADSLERWNYIVSVDRVFEGDAEYVPVLCIGVDSPDHSYLCGDFVVTHNSTTLASMIREIQIRYSHKIITVEKPIEYVFGVAGRGVVLQREVGRDTKSFANGLDSAMRQHPDVILIGEVRNKEEATALLVAADTGHLAFSTMHTNSAADTLNRIKRMFEGDEQIRVLGDLSESARGFVNQLLIRSVDNKSRFAVREILDISDPDVKSLIQHGNVRGLREYQMDKGITMEHELLKHVAAGDCSAEVAMRVSPDRPRMESLLKSKNLM